MTSSKKTSMILSLIAFSIVFLTFRFWFLGGPLSSGDWPYLFKETIHSFSFVPNPDFLWLAPYYQWTSKIFVQYLNFPWEVYERIFWFWLFLTVAYFSSRYFSKLVLGESKFNILASLIFMTNTYILMIIGGGQMGLALAYGLSPAVLGSFAQQKIIKFTIFLSFLLVFDPRVFYMTTLAIILYIVFVERKNFKPSFLISYVIAGIVNFYWIVPFVFHKSALYRTGSYFDSGSLSFFSFAHFEDAFSLLHPNWPENLFGKAYFLRPEFLLLPILAFSPFLFINKTKELRKLVLFFGILGLLGIFLSKGTQEPFGFVYSFLFEHVLGFSLFRDPTKFYLLIVMSYMVLIPFSLEQISNKVQSSRLAAKRANLKVQSFIPVLFIIFWAFTIRQGLLGQLSGTFRPHQIPNDYVKLKNFLISDRSYSKTLWIPTRHPFTFYSDIHPFLEASQLFGTINNQTLLSTFNNPQKIESLKAEKVKYVILDEDTEGVLFTDDRKYSEKVYQDDLSSLKQAKSLRSGSKFGKIVVFELQ